MIFPDGPKMENVVWKFVCFFLCLAFIIVDNVVLKLYDFLCWAFNLHRKCGILALRFFMLGIHSIKNVVCNKPYDI